MAPAGRKNTGYEFTQRHPDDKEAVEGQGPIALHGLEHLVSSDKGVLMFRGMLRRAIAALSAGNDPKGIFRDPGQARFVPTSAGSVLATPTHPLARSKAITYLSSRGSTPTGDASPQ